ncbi:MAG: hypothetical protein NVSMB1_01040 [Polyangiales bacterium]
MITCAKCSKENQDHYKFCLGCGAELPRDAAPKAFSAKTPPHGIKAVSAGAAPPFGAPPAAPNFAPPPQPPAFAQPRPVSAPQPPVTAGAPQAYRVPAQSAPAIAPAAPALAAVSAAIPQVASAAASTSAPPCPTCGHPNPISNKFCASCGTVLVQKAPVAVAPPVIASRASLTALRADGTDAGTYQLPEGSTMVGRDLGGIFGGDSYLSPKHAWFKVQGGRVTVKDERSLNGVYIKVARDSPIELKAGDIFRIGQEILRFEKLKFPPASPDGVDRIGSPPDGIVGTLALITGRESTANAFSVHAHGIHLGRERGDVVFPEDGYVSGLHCRVAPEAGRIFLTDLGSSNGTYVRFADERELKSGDVLLMGQQLFRVGN